MSTVSTIGTTPIAVPTISRPEGLNPSAIKERKVSLLSVELSRERIRSLDREIVQNVHAAARVRAVRRARRDARVRALRVRRLLLAR
ncbi:hypothetical protein ACRYCC_12910 [Actinomadura scrupuli]|uniref:hypothetical protein n=1 Tax=Actinomadura scrupuli TaxID=559629 RepID=UPI003D959F04